MTPVSKNEDLRLRDEESNGQEQEVALPLPPRTGLAAANHHPEEPEDEDEELSANNRSSRTFSLPKSLITLLATAGIIAAIGCVVVVIRAASSNMAINSMQALAGPVPIGYAFEGIGNCLDVNNKRYPYVAFIPSLVANVCAEACKCAQNVPGVTFQGMTHSPIGGSCFCLVDYITDQAVIDSLNDECAGRSDDYYDDSGNYDGTGEIESSGAGGYVDNCYKFVGGGSSKAGKTKAAKAED